MRWSDDFHEHIAQIIRETAQEILVPTAGKIDLLIEEKSPNDFVTEIDKAMEEALSQKLCAALPDSIVLGEEAAALDTGLITRSLQSDKSLWIVDPLDGTANFIKQSGGYGPIVALKQNGSITGAWIYDTLCEPVYHLNMLNDITPLPLNIGKPRGFIGAKIQKMLNAMALDFSHLDVRQRSSVSCVAYRELLLGEIDFVVYGISQPWDHFAGIAMLQAKNMVAQQWTGAPITFEGRNNALLLARDEQTAAMVMNTVIRPVIERAGLPYDEDGTFRYALA